MQKWQIGADRGFIKKRKQFIDISWVMSNDSNKGHQKQTYVARRIPMHRRRRQGLKALLKLCMHHLSICPTHVVVILLSFFS